MNHYSQLICLYNTHLISSQCYSLRYRDVCIVCCLLCSDFYSVCYVSASVKMNTSGWMCVEWECLDFGGFNEKGYCHHKGLVSVCGFVFHPDMNVFQVQIIVRGLWELLNDNIQLRSLFFFQFSFHVSAFYKFNYTRGGISRGLHCAERYC